MNQFASVFTGVKILLNHGKKAIDTASMSLQWFLSDEVIEENPGYVVVSVQSERDLPKFREVREIMGVDESYAQLIEEIPDLQFRGQRYLFHVNDAFRFIQLLSPGYHRVTLLFFENSEEGRKAAKCFLTKGSSARFYNEGIYSHRIEEGEVLGERYDDRHEDYLITAQMVSFEVPEGIFAEKPQTKFGQMLWNWVNRWHETDPVDQCQYRGRFMTAFTVQPPVVAVKLFFVTIIYIFFSFYYLIGCTTLLFIGYRPRSPIKLLHDLWIWGVHHFDLFQFSDRDYRVWALEREGGCAYYKKIPITGLEVILLYGAGTAIIHQWHEIVTLVAVLTGLVTTLVLLDRARLLNWFDVADIGRIRVIKISKDKQRRQAMRHEAEAVQARGWLHENLSLEKATTSAPPRPRSLSAKLTFVFEATKAAVCKPFQA